MGLILLIVLVIAGPTRLTKVGRAAGNGVRRLRRRVGGEDAGPPPPAPAAHDVDVADGAR
jgi:Sec-independent protein translocase protein TatA